MTLTSPSEIPHDLESETRARLILAGGGDYGVHVSILEAAQRVVDRCNTWRYEQAVEDARREAELEFWLAPLIQMGGYRHDG